MALFQPTWLGGTAEVLFRKHHEGVTDDIRWRLHTSGLTDADRDHFRTVWTQSAHQEWCAAGAFVALQEALLLAGAPVDLLGASGRFLADEMLHVQLACGMATAYGGGAPLEVDPAAIRPDVDRTLEPRLQVAELAIRVSCVGETFSLPLIASEFASASDPLSRKVLGRIAHDEAAHAKLGWLVLDWLAPALTDDERERLAAVADDAIDALRPALADDADNRATYDDILHKRVARPLRQRGIPVVATGFWQTAERRLPAHGPDGVARAVRGHSPRS
ncbi:MAG: hypothetical protein KTR31_31100 [Myxococcales bacterium]|nr:hypothetical protein [Myxococcales bacterium]